MANFKNTIDVLGDDAVIDSIIQKTIPEYKDDTITKVGMHAFYNCTALETVELPNADYLANFSFYGCTALKAVNIPKATTLGDSVFQSCEALESVTAPTLVTLNSSVFRDCKALKSVKFPALEAINGSSVFASCTALEKADFPKLKSMSGGTVLHNCTAFTALILRNTATMATLTGAMSLPSTTYVYVPSALIDQYKAATNWSAFANQFRKLEEWTVDGTVTGELATNRHMVRFFNSDGTLLGYKIVTTGSDATWDGDTPVKPDSEDQFTGFKPEPVNVTEDMDCYAQYLDPYAEQWGAVFASIAAGTYATDYAIGDTVPLNLGSEGIINMQIAAFDTDDLADGSGKAPITWIAKELVTTNDRMNPSYTSGTEGTGAIGGWEKSEMRTYLNETILPLIPENVSSMIKSVTKCSDSYDTSGAAVDSSVTTDSVWIPSAKEIFGGTSYEQSGVDYTGFFTDATSRKKCKVGSTSATHWWLRSARSSGNFFRVFSDGNIDYLSAHNTSGVAIGFCT